LYGTDVIDEDNGKERDGPYNPVRGAAVIRYATAFLDRTIPLDGVSHADVNTYGLDRSADVNAFVASLANGDAVHLADPGQFVGFAENEHRCKFLFRNNGLHIELRVDPEHPIGKEATGNVADVILESAVTTIQDCEDSVAAVDAEDKVGVYRNWLGLIKGDIEATFEKGGRAFTRSPNRDREYLDVNGEPLVLSGRSLILARNVGHLMSTDAVLDGELCEIHALLVPGPNLHPFRQERRSRCGNHLTSGKPLGHDGILTDAFGNGDLAFFNHHRVLIHYPDER